MLFTTSMGSVPASTSRVAPSGSVRVILSCDTAIRAAAKMRALRASQRKFG